MVKKFFVFLLMCFCVAIASLILPFKIAFTLATDYEQQIKQYTNKALRK